ncbi:colicin immunity domain-containing protein [Serratia rubidaea]|uniref:colicin immunity domain-containing protein n=1 Tax=Serratia rubidaea TaxID=61652 RepID=UPI000F81C904|nr:colicin immunity domain-containing protein [Serratia rubidaea]
MYSNSLELIDLIDLYLEGQVSPSDFEKKYIKLWRKYRDLDDKAIIEKETQKYLDSVFCSLDSYCSDPFLRDENDLDENGLFFEVNQLNQDWKKHYKLR